MNSADLLQRECVSVVHTLAVVGGLISCTKIVRKYCSLKDFSRLEHTGTNL